MLGTKFPEADFRNAGRTARPIGYRLRGSRFPATSPFGYARFNLHKLPGFQRAAATSAEPPTARVPDENRPAVLGKAAFVQLLADDQTGGRVARGVRDKGELTENY